MLLGWILCLLSGINFGFHELIEICEALWCEFLLWKLILNFVHVIYKNKNCTWETAGCKKKKKKRLKKDHIVYCNTKILQEEACKRAIWKNSYWGFLGIQEMCLQLRVKMNLKAINK